MVSISSNNERGCRSPGSSFNIMAMPSARNLIGIFCAAGRNRLVIVCMLLPSLRALRPASSSVWRALAARQRSCARASSACALQHSCRPAPAEASFIKRLSSLGDERLFLHRKRERQASSSKHARRAAYGAPAGMWRPGAEGRPRRRSIKEKRLISAGKNMAEAAAASKKRRPMALPCRPRAAREVCLSVSAWREAASSIRKRRENRGASTGRLWHNGVLLHNLRE